ncbi:GNAT family protein [Bacillus sp. DX4.1]|uniref:GNAT family N-acetyltransferase n=1 Tax=Bacillus sp. DX4.1 TaxID=3055867 RepID=UPI0025A07D0E|nr:GNAT family protein [Bacillus sp. DX4.1]MDM5188198.1 GNAT family protein [Bacillus sp. DX4.1]
MKKISLRNGKEVFIREVSKEDAKRMIDFYNIVGGETDFLSFGENEFSMGLTDYESFLASTRAESHSIILLATIDDEIVSIASITSNGKARTKHVGTLGIVIEEKHCGFGLGKILMNELIEWAQANGTTKKITLVTREDNTRAIELYKKVGFEEEGLLKEDTYINGIFYSTLIMSLIF